MSAQPSQEPDNDFDQRMAQFDKMFDDEHEPVSTQQAQPLATQDPDAPFIASEVHDEIDEGDESTDVIHTMQELLLAHEDTQVNRVEDPDLVRVLGELRGIAHSNVADIFQCEEVLTYIGLDENEKEIYESTSRLKVRDITKLPREVSACIQTVKVTSGPKGDTVEVKMYDKMVSLDKLMKFHGAYVKDNEQTQNSNGNILDLLLSSIGSQGMPTIENNNA